MSVGATLTVIISNEFQDDTQAAARIASPVIDLTHDLEAAGLVTPPISDVTSVPAPGTVQRVITANFTADFMATFPSDAERTGVLNNMLRSIIEARGVLRAGSQSVVLF